MRQLFWLLAFVTLTTGVATASVSPGTTNTPDPPSPKDGQFDQFQLLSESACVNGHGAGLAAPSIVVIPPSLRPPEDHGAPGYRIFISCAEGYLRTAIWNPAKNVYKDTATVAPTKP